jgi:hypothetical protein
VCLNYRYDGSPGQLLDKIHRHIVRSCIVAAKVDLSYPKGNYEELANRFARFSGETCGLSPQV